MNFDDLSDDELIVLAFTERQGDALAQELAKRLEKRVDADE